MTADEMEQQAVALDNAAMQARKDRDWLHANELETRATSMRRMAREKKAGVILPFEWFKS